MLHAYRNYLDPVKIPHSAFRIDVVLNNLTDLLDTLSGVNNNAAFEQGRFAVDRMLFEDCPCFAKVLETRRDG